MESAIRILEALVPLLQTLIWPLLLLVVLVYFRKPLREFLDNLGDFSLKVGASGVEASASRREIKAAAMLGAASAARGGPSSAEDNIDKAGEIADLVSRAASPKQARRLSDSNVLWVDDRPSNNVYEKASLEALGIKVSLSTSTEDAIARIRPGRFDAIISDMGRPPDSLAGYTLLTEMQERGIETPFILYTGASPPEYRDDARSRGALDQTSVPSELVNLVIGAIEGG